MCQLNTENNLENILNFNEIYFHFETSAILFYIIRAACKTFEIK